MRNLTPLVLNSNTLFPVGIALGKQSYVTLNNPTNPMGNTTGPMPLNGPLPRWTVTITCTVCTSVIDMCGPPDTCSMA